MEGCGGVRRGAEGCGGGHLRTSVPVRPWELLTGGLDCTVAGCGVEEVERPQSVHPLHPQVGLLQGPLHHAVEHVGRRRRRGRGRGRRRGGPGGLARRNALGRAGGGQVGGQGACWGKRVGCLCAPAGGSPRQRAAGAGAGAPVTAPVMSTSLSALGLQQIRSSNIPPTTLINPHQIQFYPKLTHPHPDKTSTHPNHRCTARPGSS